MTGLPPLPTMEGHGDSVLAALASMPDPTGTEFTTRFEHDLTQVFAQRHAVAASSGTTALPTALFATGVGPGIEVMMLALTITLNSTDPKRDQNKPYQARRTSAGARHPVRRPSQQVLLYGVSPRGPVY